MQSNEEFIKYLGQGAYGYVNLVRYSNPDGSSFLAAVKNSTDEDYDNLQRELQILCELRGYQSIVTCFGDYLEEGLSSNGKRVHKLLLEYASEGSLNAFMDNYPERKLPEWLIKAFTRMILQGLLSTHGHGYVHCDIKPDNVLVFPPCSKESSYEVKISDFGNSLEVGEVPLFWSVGMPWVGTPIYMPPESVCDGVANKTLDLWSVGCLVLEMYTGVIPWDGVELDDLATRLLCFQAPEIPETLPSDAKNFIETCFSRIPEKRGSAYELLLHPFLSRPEEEEEEKITEEKITEEKIMEEKITEEKITEEKITEEKIVEEKITEEKIMEEKITEEKRNSFLLKLFKLRIRGRSSKKKSTTDDSEKKPLKLRFFPTKAPQFKRSLNKFLRLKIMPMKKSTDFNLVSVH